MLRHRLSFLSVLLLLAALWAAPGAAGQNHAARGPFGVEPPGPDAFRPAYQKAGESPFDPLARGVVDPKLPTGAGTGGGDGAESEPNNDFGTADAMSDIPTNCVGQIATVGDVDVLTVPVAPGQPLEIDVFTSLLGGINSPLDPVMVVSDGDDILGFNDDVGPGNPNAHVNVTAPASGRIYVVIGGHAGQFGPEYRYVIAIFPFLGNAFDPANLETEPNGTPADADRVVPPGGRIGGFPEPFDVDYTYFDAPGGATVIVDVSAQIYGFPTMTTVSLYDASGRGLYWTAGAPGRDPAFNMLLPATGRYFVGIAAPGGFGPTGFYFLNVSLQDGAGSPVITGLKLVNTKYLKKITGTGFMSAASGFAVEVGGTQLPGWQVTDTPTTTVKITPPHKLRKGAIVTVCNPTGRRSNPAYR